MRLRMVVEYDGADYSGWQIQPDRPSIQGALEHAIRTITGETVRVEGAGRTDAGVHARGQVVAFSLATEPELYPLQRGLNALCGPGIVVREIAPARDGFDPRREARRRTYEYAIDNRPWPSPFRRRYAWHIRRSLDRDAMAEAAAALIGEHDFSAFRAADCDAESPIRRMFTSVVDADGGDLVYRVTATAFLRHMVRTIVGTLVEVGHGERSVEDFARLLVERDRRRSGATAPPHGLCLVRVEYD
jgi:tRNA pseudouridine38-40 synthase